VSARSATCPSCGATIEFASSTSLVVVCESCEYASYRTDVKLELIGKVAQVAPIESEIALHARGKFGDVGFEVVGQVQLDHGRGPWNEWAVALDDGTSAWLAEAQGQVLATRAVEARTDLRYASIAAGSEVDLGAEGRWTIAEKGAGRVTAIRGQLPALMKPGDLVRYADLSGPSDGFGTLDFGSGETCEAVYLGRRASVAELALDLSGAQAQPARKVKAARITCPKCAGAIDLRDPENAQRVGCPFCGALMDPRSNAMQVLAVSSTARKEPGIPIGARGKLRGQDFEVLAWLERSVVEDGERYPWDEYLLRRNDGAYRWLVCSDRQWSFVEPLHLADVQRKASRVSYRGTSFRHFSGGVARVDRVLGEVYWEVSVGDTVRSDDYVAPPLMLSFESTDDEKLVSLGTYVEKSEIETAFGLARKLPRAQSMGTLQPNTVRASLKLWWLGAVAISAVVVALALFFHVIHSGRVAYSGQHPFVPAIQGDLASPRGASASTIAPIVTDEFELDGWRGNVEVTIAAPALQHGALSVEGSLVSSETGAVHPFAVRSSGTPSDDAASIGTVERASVRIGSVPGGRYRLRLEPHAALASSNRTFDVVVRRQLATNGLPVVIIVLSWIAPVLMSIIAGAIEGARWQKSSYA
jgi:hypothetical protein